MFKCEGPSKLINVSDLYSNFHAFVESNVVQISGQHGEDFGPASLSL